MSKNKFWNKDKQVTPISDEADLENTVNESILYSDKDSNLEVLGEKLSRLIQDNEISEKVLDEMELVKEFDEVANAPIPEPTEFEKGTYHGIEQVLDILYTYQKNMYDDTYSIDTKLVADWLKIILKRKGFKV